LEALLTFVTCCAFYFMACQILSNGRLQVRTVRIVAFFASFYALLAILEALAPNGQILWLLKPWPAYAGEPFGTFVNGNHYAGLMGMLLPLVIALFLAEKPLARYGGWRERTIDFFTDPQLDKHLLAGFGALLVAVSIFLSLSRGGILSTLGALLLFALLLLWKEQGHRRALIMLLFVVAFFFAIGVFGWQPIFDAFARIRNLQGEISDGRLSYWQDCLVLWRDFPVLGSGFGSFIDSYAGYQTLFQGEHVVDHAHNDYVELLTDAGLSGVLLALWVVFSMLRGTLPGLRRRRKAFSVLLYFGSLTGLSALLLHSLTDFNLHIGANSLYFAFLGSLLVSAATTSSQHGGSSELPVLPSSWLRGLVPLTALGLLVCLLFNGGGLVAQSSLEPYVGVDVTKLTQIEQEAALESARLGTLLAPFNARYYFAEANLLAATELPSEVLGNYAQAVKLRPLSAQYLEGAARAAGVSGAAPLQGNLLKAALQLNRADLPQYKAYAIWLLDQQRRDEAFTVIRNGLTMVPAQTTDFLTQMALHGVDWPEMSPALPDLSRSWSLYAAYLDRLGRELLAEQSHRRAVRLVATDPLPALHSYWAFNGFLQKRERYEEAFSLLIDGLQLFPDSADLHAKVGTQLERQGYEVRAAEFYRKALLLNPKLGWVRKRLERLSL
jgi:O-antigen ligase